MIISHQHDGAKIEKGERQRQGILCLAQVIVDRSTDSKLLDTKQHFITNHPKP